tara:strand:+ start:559 stop:855 length:297 start_codon:yes stop_codon:yes gene_type:complete
MALTERTENDKIEIVGPYRKLQVRTATIIERDGVEVTRTFHRRIINPGSVGIGSTILVDTDLSSETSEIQGICNVIWTDAVKDSWRLRVIELNAEDED